MSAGDITKPPTGLPVVNDDGALSTIMAAWFASLTGVMQAASGTTAARPTTGLYVLKPYLDTTLGKPVWLKTVGPPAVWIDATGVAV
jgi:hypothetical protein